MIRLATLLGPALAGVTISAIGAVNILYADAATYVVAYLILVSGLPKPAASLAGAAAGEGSGVFAGARFVLAHPLLRRVTLAALLFGFFFHRLLASIPVLTDERYAGDPRVVGLLYAGIGERERLSARSVSCGTPPGCRRCGWVPSARLVSPFHCGCSCSRFPVSQIALVLLVSGLFTPMLNAPVITMIMLRTSPPKCGRRSSHS